MPLCERETVSGVVLEKEYYYVSDRVQNIGSSSPKPDIRTPEEKEKYNRHKSEKQLIRLVNTNFTSRDYYVTLTYSGEYLPNDYESALKCLANYIRRLQYLCPYARIIAVTGYGERSGRLHHHLLIGNVSEDDILRCWKFGKVAKAEHLRKNNYYNGINCGEDFTALASYLHKHAPTEHKGKRWKQTRNIEQPIIQPAKRIKFVFTVEHPPKVPSGYILADVKKNDYGYICFKYVRKVQEQLNIQPIFSKIKADNKEQVFR